MKEAAALLESACDEILLYFAIGLFAGLGVAEIERLDWSEVDFDKSEIHVIPVKAKTAQYRTLPMTENLVAWLAPYRQSQGRVAPHCDEPRRQVVRHCAGIPTKSMPNAMRHSYCSYHFNLHNNGPQTSKNAGHMSVDMLYSNYHHLVEKSAAERYFSIFPQDAQNIIKVA